VFAAIVGIRWSLATPVVVLERTGPAASLRRSWRLVRGSSWRVLGILLLTFVIVGVASSILQLPFSLAGGLSSFANTAHRATVLATIVSSIGGIIASAVTRPVTAGVTVLLYTDLRMRREGLDIALQTAASQPASPVSGPGAGPGGGQGSPGNPGAPGNPGSSWNPGTQGPPDAPSLGQQGTSQW
jgi:hypothetical protein